MQPALALRGMSHRGRDTHLRAKAESLAYQVYLRARRCDVGDFGVHVLVESRDVDQFLLFSKVGQDLIE